MAFFDVLSSQPRISSAAWWKKIQPSVSPVTRHSDTLGEKHTHTLINNVIHRLTSYTINMDIDLQSGVLTEDLCICVCVCQDRRGYGALQEHPWVSQPTDQEELRQEQMEGKCLQQTFVLRLLKQSFVVFRDESLCSNNLTRHMFRSGPSSSTTRRADHLQTWKKFHFL